MQLSGNYPFKTDTAPPFRARALALGAGTQSSVILLRTLEGHYDPAPEFAVFADTGAEPSAVYEWLEFLKVKCAEKGFPLYTLQAGDIIDDAHSTARVEGEPSRGRFASMPLYTFNQEGERNIMRRQCTSQYKIKPLQRFIRKKAGMKRGARYPGQGVEVWQGITWDELERVSPARNAWEWKRYPLIESKETRADCISWLQARGYSAPKSACTVCPYRRNAGWLRLKKEDPRGFAEAVLFDEALRDDDKHIFGWDRPAYLHEYRRPLADVVEELEEQEREARRQGEIFDLGIEYEGECSGTCGV